MTMPRQPMRGNPMTDICDRPPEVRDAILKALDADDCAEVDNDAMASLTELDLSDAGLGSFEAGAFDGLRRCLPEPSTA